MAWAVLGPIPGNCCNSTAVAVFKSRGFPGGCFCAAKQEASATRTNAAAAASRKKKSNTSRFIAGGG
jgi:hypothetical protein